MDSIFSDILARVARGEHIALCTIVAARGSTPQGRGAKMVVAGDGSQVGTLGGGCVEAEVRRRAMELLCTRQSQWLEFRLDHDYGWDDGLICGGVMEIYVQVIGPADTGPFESALSALRENRATTLKFEYAKPDGTTAEYVEDLLPQATLLIAGAGHVGHALAALAGVMDFHCIVLDDREELLSPERFPNAQRIAGDIEQGLAKHPIDNNTYVVIVTRGHRHDGRALAAVIQSSARYVGLIGSRKKIKTILADLHEQGVPLELLQRVHAPIGLEIGAITPGEIAVSIAAELVATRRGRENVAASPMKMDVQALQAWVERPVKSG